jgi:hypothetical protein
MQAAASQATTTLEVEFERASQKLSVLEAAQDRKEAASPKSPAASPWQSPFSEHAARARKLKLRRMALDGYLAERAVASKGPSHSAVLASEQRLSLDEARAWIAAELRSKSSRAAAGSRNTIPWRTHGARPAAQAALNVSRHERARREPLAASTMVPPPTREARIAMAAAMCHGSREPAATSLMTSPAVGVLSGRERPAASASARAAAAQAAHLVRLAANELPSAPGDDAAGLGTDAAASHRHVGTPHSVPATPSTARPACYGPPSCELGSASAAGSRVAAVGSPPVVRIHGSLEAPLRLAAPHPATGTLEPSARRALLTQRALALGHWAQRRDEEAARWAALEEFDEAVKELALEGSMRARSSAELAHTLEGGVLGTGVGSGVAGGTYSENAYSRPVGGHDAPLELPAASSSAHAAESPPGTPLLARTYQPHQTPRGPAVVHLGKPTGATTPRGRWQGGGSSDGSSDGNREETEGESSRSLDSRVDSREAGHAGGGRWAERAASEGHAKSEACALCSRVIFTKLLHPKPVSRPAVERQRANWGAPALAPGSMRGDAFGRDTFGEARAGHLRVCVPCYEVVRDGRGSADARRSANSAAAGGEGWLRTLNRTERASLWAWEPVAPHESWEPTLSLAEL